MKICNRKYDTIDTSFLNNPEQIGYVASIKDANKKKNNSTFTQQLPDSHDGLVELLDSMTEFNPYFRPTAKELLKHKIFDDIRMKEIEENAPYKICIDVDQYDTLKPNYEDDEIDLYSEHERIKRIKKIQMCVIKEIGKLEKNETVNISVNYS